MATTRRSGRREDNVYRCALSRHPSSSLANDCLAAMSEGLHSSFYDHFVSLLWGDSESAYLSNTQSHVDSEWESFRTAAMKICKRYASSPNHSSTLFESAWNFLRNSKFHSNYSKHASFFGVSLWMGISCQAVDYNGSYLEDEQNREVSFYAQLLSETLESLHAVYENLKLNNLRKRDLEKLSVLLCNIAASLGEANYVDYYIRDFPYMQHEVRSFHTAAAPRTPPCLFRWLERCLQLGYDSANLNDIPFLIRKNKCYVVSWARKIVSFYSLLLGAAMIGKKLSSGVYCDIAKGSASTPEELIILAMVAEGFGRHQLDLLPVGVSLPLRHALDKCRESPPTGWPASAYVLVGREDLAMACLGSLDIEHYSQSSVNLVSTSVPYMLHLQPVTIPSSFSDVTRLNSMKSEEEESSDDGMEHIFNSSTQLRYGCDNRLNEVRRLLCSVRAVAIQTSVSPSTSDQDLQQHQLWNLAQRTTALPFGRGAFTLATTYTLLTEALVIPKLVLAGRLPAQQNAMVNLDPNVRSISELRSWPEFHNGVAAGLKLAPFQGKTSRTWILYNKPPEPNFTHAGLLLALGLQEHLCVLLITDVYRYLSEEHDITTVGVLLGTAASYRGTMHPAISKMLYLHIPYRHPSSFPELELPTILQSAALMAIGLLYEGSAHLLTMKILLGEIGRRSSGDNVLEREGYAVAAGCALGLVALGRGKEAFGSVDSFVDRLFHYTGGKEVYNEKSLAIGRIRDDHNRSTGQLTDGTQINVDVTAPGAIISLALIFLKTESEVIASRIYIPATHFDLQYVRPDFIMLRIIARNLIMWNRVCPSRDWVESQIPEFVKVSVLKIGDAASDSDDFDSEALVQAYVNVVAGACISLGLKYAGTKNGDSQELLYNYAIYFLNEIKHVSAASKNDLPKGLSEFVDRGTLEICLHLIVLSLSVVMAGSGHLQTFRLLRYLRGRSSAEGNINYGIQMAGPECKSSFKTFTDDITANGDSKPLPSANMIRSHSVSGDLHGVQPDPVAADLLRKEREQETFVRMKISPSETPSADEAEVYKILQECLELRQSYVFKEDIPPWEKEVITDPSAPKPNLNPFAYDAEQKTEHFFKMVEAVVHVYTSQEAMERIFPVADATTFFRDLHHILRVISAGNIRTLCHHRLNLLEQKFNFHLMLNADREFLSQKTAPHRDFYNVRKVDTHVHHSACMNQKHLLRFIKSKLRKEPDEVVIFRDGTYLTLKEVFESLDLTGYDLNVDLLDVHADKSTFHRFDKFNLEYNPCGQSRLREIFLKQDNLIQGRFLAEVTKQVFLDLEASKYQIMAGSGHLQTFQLLRYLRGRSSAEGNINYGIQMAVSLAIGFLFLGGGTQTFSTGNSAIAALLITLYPRFPTGPNDNRCHLQAFRHLYVIAAESRRLQTVDVDTGLPVYASIETTIKETDHYSETSFFEVTPCILPER